VLGAGRDVHAEKGLDLPHVALHFSFFFSTIFRLMLPPLAGFDGEPIAVSCIFPSGPSWQTDCVGGLASPLKRELGCFPFTDSDVVSVDSQQPIASLLPSSVAVPHPLLQPGPIASTLTTNTTTGVKSLRLSVMGVVLAPDFVSPRPAVARFICQAPKSTNTWHQKMFNCGPHPLKLFKCAVPRWSRGQRSSLWLRTNLAQVDGFRSQACCATACKNSQL